MNILSLSLLSLLLAGYSHAALEEKKEVQDQDKPESIEHVWYRNGVAILSQRMIDERNRLIMIHPKGKENGALIMLHFTNGILSSFSTVRNPEGIRVSIDDFTKDGTPDFFQVIEGEEGKVEHIEAFSIVDGVLEPIPESFYEGRSHEFYYDEEIVAYLKIKLEPNDADNPVNPPENSENQPDD